MHIAVTGASGLVGSELTPLLIANGHEVTRLVRREPSDEGQIRWDPLADAFSAHPLEGVDAVVHLAGENIGQGRWNAAKKQAMCDSRIRATRTLCEGLARMATPPRTLVCASAIWVEIGPKPCASACDRRFSNLSPKELIFSESAAA